MAISNVRIRESETWKEILSQGQIWQNVLQEIRPERELGKDSRNQHHARRNGFSSAVGRATTSRKQPRIRGRS